MSQTKSQLHVLKVRQKPDSGSISTGANTEIFLDGAPFKGVTFLKFEFKAAKVTKVQMEILAKVEEIDGRFMIGSPYPSNSEPVDKTQEIVDALLKGGLVYAPRASGKTKALAAILEQDRSAVIVCDTQAGVDAITSIVQGPDARVWLNTERNRESLTSGPFANHIKIFIDEYEPGTIYPEWYAAVTSRIKIV